MRYRVVSSLIFAHRRKAPKEAWDVVRVLRRARLTPAPAMDPEVFDMFAREQRTNFLATATTTRHPRPSTLLTVPQSLIPPIQGYFHKPALYY